MPQRDLKVGDRVWRKRIKKYGTVIRVRIQTVMISFDDYGEFDRTIRLGRSLLFLLYHFSEIWAELPHGSAIRRIEDGSMASFDLETNSCVIDSTNFNTNPANAAAELLAWIYKTAVEKGG
jgi:hypothetical protein